jgi:hypothetical protein
MFQMDIPSQVRLSYESLESAYEAHADAAARLSRLGSWFRLSTLATTAVAASTAALAVGGHYAWQIAAAVATAAAFGASAAYVWFNQQPRIYGHRASAARLWVVCEKYRSLLAELHEGAIDLPALRDRRNELLQEASRIFEQTAPDDRYTFDIAARALRGPAAAAAAPAVSSYASGSGD